MQFPVKSKIEKVLPKDRDNPVLTNPYLDIEAGVVLASNNRCALSIPVEVGADDVSGPVSVDAIKAARKTDTEIQCQEKHIVIPGGVAYHREDFPAYPPISELFVSGEDAVVSITLDAKLLAGLAEAMGTDTVTLKLPVGLKRIGVEPFIGLPHVAGAVGVILPS